MASPFPYAVPTTDLSTLNAEAYTRGASGNYLSLVVAYDRTATYLPAAPIPLGLLKRRSLGYVQQG